MEGQAMRSARSPGKVTDQRLYLIVYLVALTDWLGIDVLF